jgi:large subunit ribosomal protein L23
MGILKKKTTDTSATVTAPRASKASTKKQMSVRPAMIKRVLLGVHVSEKTAGTESTGVYTFRVAVTASKYDIKHAIANAYGVVPTDVRVMNVEGKTVRFGRTTGKRSDWKKALVTLPQGSHIDIHSGV